MKVKGRMTGILFLIMTILCACGNTAGANETETQTEAAETMSETENGELPTASDDAVLAEEEAGAGGSQNTEVVAGEAVAEEPMRTGQAIADIPEGFYEYLPPSGIYVTKNYPTDGSNIYILATELYGEFPTERDYKNQINDSLSAQTGHDISVTLQEYGETTIDGCDALKAVFTYSYDGLSFKRTEYAINTDITTVIAYTQMGNANWSDRFEESAMSIRVE